VTSGRAPRRIPGASLDTSRDRIATARRRRRRQVWARSACTEAPNPGHRYRSISAALPVRADPLGQDHDRGRGWPATRLSPPPKCRRDTPRRIRLEPISGASVGGSGALVGEARAVAAEHLGRAPASQAHQVALLAAACEPLMGRPQARRQDPVAADRRQRISWRERRTTPPGQGLSSARTNKPRWCIADRNSSYSSDTRYIARQCPLQGTSMTRCTHSSYMVRWVGDIECSSECSRALGQRLEDRAASARRRRVIQRLV
jgi:hypothetical protein